MIRASFVAAAVFLGGGTLATPPVIVREAGPGPTGPYLAAVLALPDTRVLIADTITLPVDSTFTGTLVVIGKRVAISAKVGGDVVVVGGDLFIHPGAQIAGRAVAIGGGVYPSLLGQVRGGSESHPDFTFDATTVNGVVELHYRETRVGYATSWITLPGTYGLRMPSYDRSNGLSLPIGPLATLDSGRLAAQPLLTYRSQLGKIDPSVDVQWKTGRRFWISGFAGRETRSNDRWIAGDLSNSLNVLFNGRDLRNWYRASAANVFANRVLESTNTTATYSIGGSFERASSERPDSFPTGGPWSLIGKHSDEGVLRPNPQIVGGDIGSIIAAAKYEWAGTRITGRLDLTGELPVSVSTGEHFGQLTMGGELALPTWGLQRYRFDFHAILTRGDTAPGQRFGYLGGSGTLSTIEPALSLGGDELIFFENRYDIPVPAVTLPYAGYPTLTLRHIVGTAGIQRFPTLTQNVGIRLSLSVFRLEELVDPKTGKREASVSLALIR